VAQPPPAGKSGRRSFLLVKTMESQHRSIILLDETGFVAYNAILIMDGAFYLRRREETSSRETGKDYRIVGEQGY
jgi:hypothetical protein